jgi:hypothetical protein
MTIPVPVKAEARTSIEIENSCNGCCPKFCCFGRKVKHHKHPQANIPRAEGSLDVSKIVENSLRTPQTLPPVT